MFKNLAFKVEQEYNLQGCLNLEFLFQSSTKLLLQLLHRSHFNILKI